MAANDAFMQEYHDSTAENPSCRRERVWETRAAFELEIFDGAIHLGCVRSFERGNGNGTAALTWLCELADKHECAIRGTIKPCGQTRPRLNAAQLRQWYKRHGFKVTRGREIRREGK